MNKLNYNVWERVKTELIDSVKSGKLYEASGNNEFMNDLQEVLDYIVYPNVSFVNKNSKRNIFLQTLDLDPKKIPYNVTSIAIMQMFLIGFSENGSTELKRYSMDFLDTINKSHPNEKGTEHKKINFIIEKLYEHVFELWALHSGEIKQFQQDCANRELEEAKEMEKEAQKSDSVDFMEPRNEEEAKLFAEKLKDIDKKSPEEVIKDLQSMMKK